jgi:hypothetical protein
MALERLLLQLLARIIFPTAQLLTAELSDGECYQAEAWHL